VIKQLFKRNKKTTFPITSIYDVKLNSISDEPINFSAYKGKKILFVNVASKCGFTPQYSGLQDLYDLYQNKLMIIGVPCNQFLRQEPGTNEQIAAFCEKNYGVSFPISEKIDVKGSNQHPLYQWLTLKSNNGLKDSKVKWNFQKYLVNEKGELMDVFSSNVRPLDDRITNLI
jgi:glutathione peroxidase